MTKSTIDKSTREKLYSQRGKVFWMTGLSASGKTTIADAFEKTLHESRLRTCILDGDNLRQVARSPLNVRLLSPINFPSLVV